MEIISQQCDSCSSTKLRPVSYNVANCYECSAPNNIDAIEEYNIQGNYPIKSLDEIAKEQALIDMCQSDLIDWAEVFEYDNITNLWC